MSSISKKFDLLQCILTFYEIQKRFITREKFWVAFEDNSAISRIVLWCRKISKWIRNIFYETWNIYAVATILEFWEFADIRKDYALADVEKVSTSDDTFEYRNISCWCTNIWSILRSRDGGEMDSLGSQQSQEKAWKKRVYILISALERKTESDGIPLVCAMCMRSICWCMHVQQTRGKSNGKSIDFTFLGVPVCPGATTSPTLESVYTGINALVNGATVRIVGPFRALFSLFLFNTRSASFSLFAIRWIQQSTIAHTQ